MKVFFFFLLLELQWNLACFSKKTSLRNDIKYFRHNKLQVMSPHILNHIKRAQFENMFIKFITKVYLTKAFRTLTHNNHTIRTKTWHIWVPNLSKKIVLLSNVLMPNFLLYLIFMTELLPLFFHF